MSVITDRDERGAVAVMMAVLVVLLFIIGGLAADMGNAWARKRDMQTQADVATISAANWGKDNDHWPADTPAKQAAITQKAAEYLLEDNNSAIGQGDMTVAQVVSALTDGDASNGDIEFRDGGQEMELVAPPATVNFGLATAVGLDSMEVTARATVGLFSELPGSGVIPFWLPDGCAYGPLDADTTNGNGGGNSGGNSGGDSGGGGSTVGDFSITMTPNNVDATQSTQVTIKVSKNDIDRSKPVPVSFKSGGTQFDASVTPSTKGSTSTLIVSIGPANVTSTDSTWTVTVTGTDGSVSDGVALTVGSGGTTEPPDEGGDGDEPLETTCTGSDLGNFGQMNSPRDEGGLNHQRELGLNIAEGLDHNLEPYTNAGQISCQSPPLANAQHDDVSRDGNNCITSSTGNDGPWIYDGLVGGLEGRDGRLEVSRGATKPGCNGGNGDISGVTINNDLLSCYLEDGYALADLVPTSGVTSDMLDPSVVDSPRLVWLPVVYATNRDRKDFQPILRFVPGFITDETQGDNTTSNATSANGVTCNGNGNCNSISKLQVFTFNPDALPDEADSPVVDYDPSLGRETVRLID